MSTARTVLAPAARITTQTRLISSSSRSAGWANTSRSLGPDSKWSTSTSTPSSSRDSRSRPRPSSSTSRDRTSTPVSRRGIDWSVPNEGMPNIGGTSPLTVGHFKRIPVQCRPHNLLIHVPRSALPSDVVRQLHEVRAVDSGFTQSSLTPYPLGAPRKNGLNTLYHVTLPDPESALATHRLLSSRPLFAPSSVGAGPAASRPALGGTGLEGDGVRDLAAVGFCALEARAWADKLLSRAEEGARKSGLRYDPVSVDWTIDPALSGRRVLLRGLPGGIQHKDVYNVAGAAVDEAANRPVRRLPPQQWSNVSSWAITTPSVSHAHELVRRLHMNYFFNDRDFLMRADVVW